MESASTEGNYFLSVTPVPTHNLSSQIHQDSYLHKLAHLDEALYNDFYSLWIALIVINVLIFLVGILLNSLALYVFCFRTKPKTTSVIYTINLVITDLLVGFSLPTRIIMYYSGGVCLTCSFVHIFSYFVNMYCSILFLTCICVDRYLAIVQVEASHKWRNQNYAKGICLQVHHEGHLPQARGGADQQGHCQHAEELQGLGDCHCSDQHHDDERLQTPSAPVKQRLSGTLLYLSLDEIQLNTNVLAPYT
ncbi:UNVERIFIED_CONTAM: hypothetical protein FKN15_042120 [Acipenser sinensis]